MGTPNSLKSPTDKSSRARRKFHIYDEYKFDFSKLRRRSSSTEYDLVSSSSKSSPKYRRKKWTLQTDDQSSRDRRKAHVFDDESVIGLAFGGKDNGSDGGKSSSQDLSDSFPTMHVYDMEPYNLEGSMIFSLFWA